jgi:hypothetical protein
MLFNNTVSTVSGIYYQTKLYNLIKEKYKEENTMKLSPV